MNYLQNYTYLKDTINFNDKVIDFRNCTVHNFTFESNSSDILPGKDKYCCKQHNFDFLENNLFHNNIPTINDDVFIKDCEISENKIFKYHIFLPKRVNKVSKIILLLHGFNEKSWNKYLPWAQYLSNNTGSAVILFPISFHMDRAPAEWNDKRAMFDLSKKRKAYFPDIIDSSLSNVATSMRLNYMPQRFIWSGLQSYYDIIKLIEEIKNNKFPIINKDASVDLFGYSIGCMLAEILKLSNYKSYFTNSKACLFCGGAVFNGFSPVSKFILDSEANVAIHSYITEYLQKHVSKDNRIEHYLGETHPEGMIFRSMLDYHYMKKIRENLLRKNQQYFYSVALKNDKVIPYYEIINTMNGSERDINTIVDIIAPKYSYTHENPFPSIERYNEVISDTFSLTFSKFADFFNKQL
ncbi:MAG: DUF6051 family protein [Candidatus Delongbacteria bacterium]|jgi:hypothetical protein|nr:DUF6051 family protein [Candidatus Delongbacteria bacterium]